MSALTPIILSNNGTGVAIACTDSSGSTRVALLGDGDAFVVTNVGTFIGYLAIGGSTVTAVAPGSTASYPILVGTKEDQIATKLTESLVPVTHAAGICNAGENTILIVHRVQR